MATNDFREIKTFSQLQEARKTLRYQTEKMRGKLWVPFAISIIRSIRSRLADK